MILASAPTPIFVLKRPATSATARAADDLVIGCLQVEVGLAIAGFQTLVAGFVGTVLLDGPDAAFRTGASAVQLAGQDYFPIACFQDESELAIFGIVEFVKTCHDFPPTGWDG